MRISICVGVVCSILISSSAYAQSKTALWDQLDVPSIAYAQGLTYKLYVTPSGGSTTSSVLTGVICSGNPPTASCSASLGTVSTTIGTKVELTATDAATGVESPKSNPFIKPAGAPTNLRLTLLEMLKSLTRLSKASLATLQH